MMAKDVLAGMRHVLELGSAGFPELLAASPRPPKRLYCIGSPDALEPGLAVVGARRATPYGIGCAQRFSRIAAEKGVVIISGGALGCDSEAHRAAIDAGGRTVVVLGGGCDCVYPARHFGLFQSAIEKGGAVVSEQPWDVEPRPYMFRERNRIISGLADAVLIVEAGLPSGTFSTADEALEAGREVLVVPGSITSAASLGANRLLYQGATPVIDDETFEEALFRSCGALVRPGPDTQLAMQANPLVEAVKAQPMGMDALFNLAATMFGEGDAATRLMEVLVEAEAAHEIARQPDGKWGPAVPWK